MNIVKVEGGDFGCLWSQLFLASEFQHPLYQPWNIEYYKALAQESDFEDCSLVVEEQASPLLGLRMALRTSPTGNRELSGFGLPLLYLEKQGIDSEKLRGAHRLLRAHSESIFRTCSVDSIVYQDFLKRGTLSFIGRHMLEKGARAVPHFTQMIDLAVPETILFREVRKSYKSLINWGKKNLNLRVIGRESIAPEDVERFRQLHFHAAGRETRSHHTWHLQYEMVSYGEAFIILGEFEGELVTAALFPCSSKYCFYGVSASKGELSSKPLSHVVIWRAMLHAKEQGCRFFELAPQLYPNQGDPLPTQKELSISTFKHGFGGETRTRLNIVWRR